DTARWTSLTLCSGRFRSSSGTPRPVRRSARPCSPALKACAAPWRRRALAGSRSRIRRRERGRFSLALEAAALRRGFSLVAVTRLQSGLKDDVFERFATRVAVEIGGDYAPAAISARANASVNASCSSRLIAFNFS